MFKYDLVDPSCIDLIKYSWKIRSVCVQFKAVAIKKKCFPAGCAIYLQGDIYSLNFCLHSQFTHSLLSTPVAEKHNNQHAPGPNYLSRLDKSGNCHGWLNGAPKKIRSVRVTADCTQSWVTGLHHALASCISCLSKCQKITSGSPM